MQRINDPVDSIFVSYFRDEISVPVQSSSYVPVEIICRFGGAGGRSALLVERCLDCLNHAGSEQCGFLPNRRETGRGAIAQAELLAGESQMEVNVIKKKIGASGTFRRQLGNTLRERKQNLIFHAVQLHVSNYFKRVVVRLKSALIIALRKLKVAERSVVQQQRVRTKFCLARVETFAQEFERAFGFAGGAIKASEVECEHVT